MECNLGISSRSSAGVAFYTRHGLGSSQLMRDNDDFRASRVVRNHLHPFHHPLIETFITRGFACDKAILKHKKTMLFPVIVAFCVPNEITLFYVIQKIP
jgi:hypothetical protein